ncbi:glycosyltransferase family 2 protein [Neobacillus sp. Marseille-QA0830]
MDISVVMAVFNGEQHLEEALNSILHQTYKDFEFIIVNDGSTDRTKAILDSYTDPRLQVIHLEHNQGAANALNVGIRLASGKWIAIQDSDDVSLSTRLEEQLAFITENPDFAGVGSLIECIPGESPISTERLQAETNGSNRLVHHQEIFDNRFYGCSLVHGSMLYSKEIYEKAGHYDPRYRIAYDYDLWLKMQEYGHLTKITRTLYQWRINLDSLSRNDTVTTCDEVLKASASAIHRMLSKNLGRKPRVLVVGTKRACIHFFNHISHSSGLKVSKYIRYSSDITRLIKYLKKGNIDAVILLDSFHQTTDMTESELLQYGLQPNKSLFRIWNVVN